MRTCILLGLITFLLACEQPSSAPASGDQVDLRLYEVEEDGSGLQRAIMIDVNGSLVEEGFVRNGVKTGTWVKYHPEGKSIKSIASYIDGQLNGVFVEMDKHNQELAIKMVCITDLAQNIAPIVLWKNLLIRMGNSMENLSNTTIAMEP